jgi:preprotein translocase subunit SecA
MLNSLVKNISKIFGDKSERDLKKLNPLVDEINRHFESYRNLSHDELRSKTTELKGRIGEHLKGIDDQIEDLRAQIDQAEDSQVEERERAYEEIDRLNEERDEELEVILKEILPEAFAVVKETARRFSENEVLEVSANDFDRTLATERDFVSIQGEKALYQNSWEAAGNTVVWNMVHYDVQLIGGIVLHEGKIAEMATGEGKTLVSTLPAYLNALGGKGVHIITVNDYLARRDAEWNGPLFMFHGLRVDCIEYHKPNSAERRAAYQADITYGTNNEFGFDYLRDNMAHLPEELVQKKLHFAMVDEVDSVLIDDARTPLIISGPVPKGDQHEFHELKPRIQKLVEEQKRYVTTALSDAKKLIADGKDKEAGMLLLRCHRGLPKYKPLIKYLSETGMKSLLEKTENYYLQDQQKEMHKVDEALYFTIDERHNSIEMTEKGLELITKQGEDKQFFIMPDVGGLIADIEKLELDESEKAKRKDAIMRDFSVKSERIHSINQLLKAYTLFERDNEYIIQDGKIKIVDEQTGRVMDGRRYSDGLHQAIEAKENVKVEAATQTFATITLQNYFRMYHKLAGMTGTAETEAGELWDIYELEVMVIPTNKPIVRDDREDKVYKTMKEKFNAVMDEIEVMQKAGRPILVGTTNVEVSEVLSRMLKMRRIKHNVLNAKQHQREAEIVAEAGLPGSVTIATNMAGRGTDIKLGPGVKESGGLAIIGTERHESRRVDRQLRGRAGRQGDPGSSQFFVSLEDDLMRMFGSERVSRIMDRFNFPEGEVIQHPLITRRIEQNQKKVEQNNFSIRKRLLEYDDVMNKQRTVIYARRRHALYGERLTVDINNSLYDWVDETVGSFHDTADYEGLQLELLRHLACETQMDFDKFKTVKRSEAIQQVFEELSERYFRHENEIIDETLPVLQNIHKDRGGQIQNVLIPFTDGSRSVNVSVNLEKVLKSNGREVFDAFERYVVLAHIDEHWKEHLRELDDLKQSVSNASYEQKDPLLIYKLESFNLFQSMVSKLNTEILSMLFKGEIPKQNPDEVKEAQEVKRTDLSRMKTSRTDDIPGTPTGNAPAQDTRQVDKAPVRAEQKIGRNDPCPCGSGKKYKKCHGKDSF